MVKENKKLTPDLVDDLDNPGDKAGDLLDSLSEDKNSSLKAALADDKSDDVVISKSKTVLIKRLLENIKESNDKLIQLLSVLVSDEDEARFSIGQAGDEMGDSDETGTEVGKIIEGVFDGENMIGPDGKQYSVPANYASKSKLVEGDILKLTITKNGIFVYKQIGPIDRIRVVGKLEKSSDGNFTVTADGRQWRILPASVTYFKGGVDDEVVLLIPKTGESKWAAVENVIRNKDEF